MPDKYIAFVKNRVISTVTLNKESDQIVLQFDSDKRYLVLSAEADCCSESWFETYDNVSFQTLVGKEIVNIDYERNEEIYVPPSGRQEYDKNYLVTIKCSGGINFVFLLRNSSNGYYSGWLDISVQK